MPSRRQRPVPYRCHTCGNVYPSYQKWERHADEAHGGATGFIVPRAKRPGGAR